MCLLSYVDTLVIAQLSLSLDIILDLDQVHVKVCDLESASLIEVGNVSVWLRDVL